MSELKPIPRALRKRPVQSGYDVVATDKGWFGVSQGRKNPDAVLQECKGLYTKLEELELLTPNDVYYREHGTLQIASEPSDKEDEDETPEEETVDPDNVETETNEESEESTEVESDDEQTETQDEPEEDKSAKTTDVPEEKSESASDKPEEKSKPELEPLETLEAIDEKVLANYPAETVKAFAKDLDLGEFPNRKQATAAILDFVKG